MSKKQDMLDIIISRAEQSKDDKLKFMNVKSDALGDVVVKIPSYKKLAGILDDIPDDISTWEATLYNAHLVFECTPLLRDNFETLSEAYGEKEPDMLTYKIFEAAQSIGEINDIAQKITDTLGATKTVIKN